MVAFGVGAFAASANIRQLVLAARASHRAGLGAWHGVVGRANGGLVVHVGVVVIAVALTAATGFGHRGEVTLRPGHSAVFDGHRITYVQLSEVTTPAKQSTEAVVRVDGGKLFRPAVSQFGSNSEAVGTPAIDSGLFDDVYLTVDALPTAGNGDIERTGAVTVGVTVQPLVVWLWAGGAILAVGAVLAAIPGRRRRRATDPASQALPALAAHGNGAGEATAAPGHVPDERSDEPVGAGTP